MNQKLVIICIIIMFLPSINFVSITNAKHSKETIVPDYVEIGDLLFMDYPFKYHPLRNSGYMNDHIAIYIGNNEFIHAHYPSEVKTSNYEFFLTNFECHIFGYVLNASVSQKNDAAKWAQSQIGKRYQLFPEISKKGSNNRWYNAELIWAAYYNQDIEIDQNGWDEPSIVTVPEIVNDLDTETYIEYTVPNYVQRGDLIFMDNINNESYWSIPGYSNDHTAIYLGHDYRDGSYFINALGPGVSYITYDCLNKNFKSFTFYYVNNANKSQVEGAIEWVEQQFGAQYQCFFPEVFKPRWWYVGMWELGLKCADPDNKSIKTADRFYCCELVWAAYYNQGIDIDENGWTKEKPKPNEKVGKFFLYLWKQYGWEYAYVDCYDIIESQNMTQRLPML